MTFLDVTKAYDKAWLNAIMYTVHKNGLEGMNWKIVKELNSNLTAKVRTKYELTRTIQIRDSIRQGGILSVIEYANLMDEIAKELQEKSAGYQKIWSNTTMGCLLWMADVVLIHHDKEEIQKMINITNEIAKRYHIKFGKEKEPDTHHRKHRCNTKPQTRGRDNRPNHQLQVHGNDSKQKRKS